MYIDNEKTITRRNNEFWMYSSHLLLNIIKYINKNIASKGRETWALILSVNSHKWRLSGV